MAARAQVGSFLIEEILNWPLEGLEQEPLRGPRDWKNTPDGTGGGEAPGRSSLNRRSRTF